VVDWCYIFSISKLGVYPLSVTIYNVVEFLHLFHLSEMSSTLTLQFLWGISASGADR
jgi:hypothetical protein